MGNAAWMLVAGLAIVCVVLGVLLLRGRRTEAPPAEPAVTPAVSVPPTPVPAEPPAAVAPVVTVPPPVAPAPAAKPAAAPAPTEVVAAAPAVAKPVPAAQPAPAPAPVVAPARRFELIDAALQDPVLSVERAGNEAWQDGTALEPTPLQREALAALLPNAQRLEAVPGADDRDLFVVRLRQGAALALARGELAGAPGGELVSRPPLALDPANAANVAAVALALHCGPAYLTGLRGQVTETKALVGSLHPKLLAQGEGKLKASLQDLTRYLREAEENYAGAIRKPVFIARVADLGNQAETLWRVIGEAVVAARAQIDVQLHAPRFGEVQLERSLAALRELQGQRRLQDAAARILAGWQLLRLALGEASTGADLLQAAAQALHDGAQVDLALTQALQSAADAAKAPDYVGKAEFVANRSAVRELLQRIAAEPLEPARQHLGRAEQVIDAGFAGNAALALLLRLDAQGRAAEVRAVPVAA